MKVYIVTQGEAHEGDTILGVYARPEDADQATIEAMKYRAGVWAPVPRTHASDPMMWTQGCDNVAITEWNVIPGPPEKRDPWHVETIDHTDYWRHDGVKNGRGVSLVVSPTQDSERFAAHSGPTDYSASWIAKYGAFHGMSESEEIAKRAILGWLEGA